MREKILFAWSGGKDSAMAMSELRKNTQYQIVALLTTVTEGYDRISMHGVRRELLEEQAASIGLPLEQVPVPKESSNEEYEKRMRETLERYRESGVTSVAFGDIFLEELRKYREENLAKIGMKGIFPLWKRGSREIAHSFIDAGFKAIITCVDSKSLDKRFAGRAYTWEFLSELPRSVDPCGENGEFHSFVSGGPIFRRAIRYRKGDIVLRDDRFWYFDLIPCR